MSTTLHNLKLFVYRGLVIVAVIMSCFPATHAFNAKNSSKFVAQIAIVDIPSVLESSIAIHSIRKSVDDISKQIHQDILKKETEFKEIESKLLEKQSSITEEDFNKEISNFNRDVKAAHKEMREKKLRLAHSHSEAVGTVQQEVRNIISKLAEKYDIDIIISDTQILHAKNDLNITSEVIKELNNSLKHVKIIYE